MPAERLLAVEFATSRTTVRKALLELVSEGRLDRIQGKGTFVARPKVYRTLQLTSYTEDMRAQGLNPASQVLDIGYVAADEALAALLEVEPEDRVLRIERLRLAGGEPMAIEATHLSARRFPGLRRNLTRYTSLYTTLAEVYGVRPAEADETIETSPRPRARRDCSARTSACRCCCCPATHGTRTGRRSSGCGRCTGVPLQVHGRADASGAVTSVSVAASTATRVREGSSTARPRSAVSWWNHGVEATKRTQR